MNVTNAYLIFTAFDLLAIKSYDLLTDNLIQLIYT